MRFKSLFYPLVFISLSLASCEFNCSVGESSTAKEDEKNKPVEKNGALLYNGIQLEASKLKVKKAYLVVDNDSGERIAADNFVDINKGVKLILLVDKGWTETEGRVWLGASTKVMADNGETVLENPDLFKEYDQAGVKPEDAKAISLSVYFPNWKATRPVSLDVSFRVWDKRSDGFVQGSYIIHTK